jgi:DNA-binding NtrC family response regulator
VIIGAFDRLMRPERLADYAILERFRKTGTVLYTPEGARDLWLIREALAAHGGRRAQTARHLGVTREGLYKKMQRLGIA